MMNNDDALRDMVWMLNGVPLGASSDVVNNLTAYSSPKRRGFPVVTDISYAVNGVRFYI